MMLVLGSVMFWAVATLVFQTFSLASQPLHEGAGWRDYQTFSLHTLQVEVERPRIDARMK